MIEIVRDKLPKEYERVVLEEYYDFFTNMYGNMQKFFRGKITFSTDESKLNKKDLADPILASSIGVLASVSNNKDIEFVLYKENDRPSAIARIRVTRNSDIHIAEILFLDYQSEQEKNEIIEILLERLELYAQTLNCKTLYYEIPKFDDLGTDVALSSGFKSIEEQNRVTSQFRTYVFYKDLELKREENGCTFSRKQREKQN